MRGGRGRDAALQLRGELVNAATTRSWAHDSRNDSPSAPVRTPNPTGRWPRASPFRIRNRSTFTSALAPPSSATSSANARSYSVSNAIPCAVDARRATWLSTIDSNRSSCSVMRARARAREKREGEAWRAEMAAWVEETKGRLSWA